MINSSCDVVVCYYRKPHLWPSVANGLFVNRDHIGTVYVVNDERWDNGVLQDFQRKVNGRFDCQFLWHEHDGFGHHKSLNQGAKAVKTEYFIHQDDDIVMQHDCVAKLLEDVDETKLLAGLCDDIKVKINGETLDLSEKLLVRQDRRTWSLFPPEDRYLDVRDCLMCCNTKTYRDLGGRDEGYPGYGFIDYDFGIRWMMKHGLDSFQMGRGRAWNINGLEHPQMWTPENRDRFKKMVVKWHTYLENNVTA